jgi:hypothetical protein
MMLLWRHDDDCELLLGVRTRSTRKSRVAVKGPVRLCDLRAAMVFRQGGTRRSRCCCPGLGRCRGR